MINYFTLFFIKIFDFFHKKKILNFLKNKFNKFEILFDVGSNTGSSIIRYKKLNIAFRLFRFLQEKDTQLKTFFIVGNRDDLPWKIRTNKNVIVDIGSNRESLIHLLSSANYYISASQIENSSIAALEGLVFSKSVILSDIPSHREMLKDMDFEELYIDGMNDLFLVANFESNLIPPNIHSWEQANFKFYEILENSNI